MTLKPFRFVSVSQVTLHRGCARKWWFNKRMGLPIQQAASAALGEEVHKGQETCILTGDESAVHPLARSSLPLLRELRERRVENPERVFVERPLSYALDNGLIFTGKIDVLDTIPDKMPLVLDWKTGNPNYFKTAEDLRRDPQMATYAKVAIDLTGADGVEVAHYGIPTKGSGGGYVSAILAPEEVENQWLNLVRETNKLIETAAHESPGAVPHNPQNCVAYGRPCDFLSKCEALKSVRSSTPSNPQEGNMPLSPNDPFITRLKLVKLAFANAPVPAPFVASMRTVAPSKVGEVMEALMVVWPDGNYPEALNALLDGTAPEPAAQPTPPVVGSVAPPEAVKPTAPPTEVKAAQPTAPPTEVKAEVSVDDRKRKLFDLGWTEEDMDHLDDEAFVLVSDMGWARDAVLFDVVDDDNAPDGEGWTNFRPKPAPKPAPTPTPAPSTEPGAAPEPAPRRRGRPPKAKTEAAPVVEVTPAPVVDALNATVGTMLADIKYGGGSTPVVEVTPRVVVVEAAAPTENAASQAAALVLTVATKAAAEVTEPDPAFDTKAALFLFVDCIPEVGYGNARHLDTLLAPFMQMAAANYKDEKTGKVVPLSHYGLIPFGRGPAIVAAYVMENLDIFHGVILVDSTAPCSAAVLEVLRPRADVLVTRRGR